MLVKALTAVQDTYVAQTSLPRGRDLVIAILGEMAILSVELREGIYNCEQQNINQPTSTYRSCLRD
jgi:hypothetical protein